jgi:cytochrome b561
MQSKATPIPTHNSFKPSKEKAMPHSLIAKIFHWGFMFFFIYALTQQVGDVTDLEDSSLLQYEMVFASIFLLLLAARYFYMQKTRPTSLPKNTPELLAYIARCGHLAMYASLAAIPATGIFIGTLYWSGIKSGIYMDIAIVLHEGAIGASFFTIAIHVAAAWYHRRMRDGVWDAMVPIIKE